MRAAKVQASLRIRAVSPEPSLLAHTSSESRGTFRQKARSLTPLNVWACAVKICHDGMLEDTNSLDGAHIDGDSFMPDILPASYVFDSVVKNRNAIKSTVKTDEYGQSLLDLCIASQSRILNGRTLGDTLVNVHHFEYSRLLCSFMFTS